MHSFDRTSADYTRWTFDQMIDIGLIQQMRANGMSVDDIAAVAESGKVGIREAAYNSSVSSIRTNRRTLKAIVHLRKQIKRFDAIGKRDGYYLRYLPQRWMALLPVAENMPGLLDMDSFVQHHINLQDIVSIVGWSPTYSNGTITSLAANLNQSTTYTFSELASPPMPSTTGSMVVDGGCYRVVCPSENTECANAQCDECARFGRIPNASDHLAWSTAEEAGLVVDRTVLPETLNAPYKTGMWADATEQVAETGKFESFTGGGPGGRPGGRPGGYKPHEGGNGGAGRKNLPTVLPRLMPQNCTLPLCATACILPAGVYLCHQHEFEERDIVLQRMLGVLRSMHIQEATESYELEMSKLLAQRSEQWREDLRGKRPGPFLEPFAAPRDFGDPAMFHFVRDISEDSLPGLTLLTNAALHPEDGVVVVHTDVPVETQSYALRQELQVLLDPAAFRELVEK